MIKSSNFINSFLTIFDHCLDFNISLDLNYEKVGGLKEQRAFKIVEKIGGYNEFNSFEFRKLLDYCNNNFIKYYGAGNCNNYSKDYNINFGRECSIVFYLTFTAKTEKEVLDLCKINNLQLLTPEDNMSKKDKLDWSLNFQKKFAKKDEI